MNTVKKHENVYIHIKKKTLFKILRGILAVPFFFYVFLGSTYAYKYVPTYEIRWYDPAIPIAILISFVMYIGLTVGFIHYGE